MGVHLPLCRRRTLATALLVAAVLLPACRARPVSETPEWFYFDWLAEAPYAPVFLVLDTESSLGPYAEQPKSITMKDLVKMHGHACDGLVVAAGAFKLAADALYPDGVIDRTDTGCVTRNSPCYGDVAAYLSGGRIRFGTQKIDPELGDAIVLHRFSTGEAVKVTLAAGVFPQRLAELERRLRGGDFTQEELRECQALAWDFARDLLQRPLAESFALQALPELDWKPDVYEHLGPRGDIVNRER